MTAEPVRVVLAVALAAALVGVAFPAVEDAREERRSGLAREAAADLHASIRALVARDDAVLPGESGARQVATVRVPAGDTAVRVGVRRGPTDAVEWRANDRSGRFQLGVDVRVATRGNEETASGPDATLTLRRAGHHRLVFALVEHERRRIVRVRRFKSSNATTGTR